MDHSKKRYNIGEVAELLGVSRDTLRIYEEEGLVAPMRGENGYRLYSDEDICGLISIKFHRLNDVPMKEIRNIIDPSSDKADSMGHIRDIILRRIEAEEAELLRHRRNLGRLRLSLRYYDSTDIREAELKEVCFYRISAIRNEFKEVMGDWFRLSASDSDLGLCYLCCMEKLYGYSEEGFKGFLMIKEHELIAMEREDLMEAAERVALGSCLVMRTASKSPVPSETELSILKREAAELGLSPRPGAPFYSYFTCRHEDRASGGPRYILELCLPVEK